MFGIKTKVQADEPEMDGIIVARIQVDRVNRYKSKIKAYAVERSSGETVFKVRYTASNKSEVTCYYDADKIVRQFAKDNDYILDNDISTNIDLPTIRVSNKRTR